MKKVIEYFYDLCYSLIRIGIYKEGSFMSGIVDVKALACYIKKYYLDKFKKSEISPLKLQKSLYFCFAYWGGFIRKNNKFSDDTKEITFDYSEFLFNSKIEAWVYGPVIPDVYHEKELDKYYDENIFAGKEYVQEFINNILDDVLAANDFKLVEVSHQDKCWKKNFKPNSKYHNCEIPFEEIISEYAKNN